MQIDRCASKRQGAFLRIEEQDYRLPEPLFSLVEAIDGFAAADTVARRQIEPTRKVAFGLPTAHIGATLGDDGFAPSAH